MRLLLVPAVTGVLCCFCVGSVSLAEDDGLPVLLQEGFDDQTLRNWAASDPDAWKLENQDGNQVLHQFQQSQVQTPVRSPFNRCIRRGVTVGDFQLDVDLQSTARDYPHRSLCLFFGYQDPAHFYYVHLAQRADDHANQIFIVNNAPRLKISTKSTEGTPWDNEWHHVRIKRNVGSGAIEVFFDDLTTPVMTASDKTFTWGEIGIGSFDDTGRFDNIVLRGKAVERPMQTSANSRRPPDEASLRHWLENMIWHHRFSEAEITAATGLSAEEIAAAKARFMIEEAGAPPLPKDRLLVLPYPGGRHPRIGFLEGAIEPQRETKVSVFTPWHDPQASQADYVVVDVPEAIWSNLGLTYLAHTHVPTVWTKQGVTLEPLEWESADDGSFSMHRQLPNGIEFRSVVEPQPDHVRMQIDLTNGTDKTLSDLRVQNCVMLKGADGFTEQTNDNNVDRLPYAARHDPSGKRWIITAWKPGHRAWGNFNCPCLHSDPKFDDCPPGETKHIVGWLSFYEGTDIQSEFDRIEATNWWQPFRD